MTHAVGNLGMQIIIIFFCTMTAVQKKFIKCVVQQVFKNHADQEHCIVGTVRTHILPVSVLKSLTLPELPLHTGGMLERMKCVHGA